MNVNKQFINIAGILLVVVVLTAGIALIALPMFSQAQATQAQTATVEQTNSVYQGQIDALSAAEARSDEIDASLAALRTEIAATPQLDDVFEIVATAAEANQATIESVVAAEPTAFAARPPSSMPADSAVRSQLPKRARSRQRPQARRMPRARPTQRQTRPRLPHRLTPIRSVRSRRSWSRSSSPSPTRTPPRPSSMRFGSAHV